jgi:hypothetical protein
MVGGSRRKERKCYGKDTARKGLSNALKQIEGGAKGLEMCRELGISEDPV